jgi:hypothetical protein
MAQVNENKRSPLSALVRDPGSGIVSNWFSSPHTGTIPSLFGDGSVRPVSLTIDNTLWRWLWAYNDGNAVPAIPGT